MRCQNPYVKGGHAYPCRTCPPCRINRVREWTHRIILEAMQHSDSTFVTLTYRNESLRTYNGQYVHAQEMTDLLPSLQPKDLQDWLKRLRWEIKPKQIRYFAVGEYGDDTERPHYHVALFGYAPCRWTQTQQRKGPFRCCVQCELVYKTWGHGNIYLGTLGPESAQYISGYVTKKLTNAQDPRLKGRHPEFSRMSTHPGLGSGAMDEVASTLMTLDLEKSMDDVPSSLRHGKRIMPLGRYLRRKLRTKIGREANAPESTIQANQERLRPLYEAARLAPPVAGARDLAFKNLIIDTNAGAVANSVARYKLKPKRGTL